MENEGENWETKTNSDTPPSSRRKCLGLSELTWNAESMEQPIADPISERDLTKVSPQGTQREHTKPHNCHLDWLITKQIIELKVKGLSNELFVVDSSVVFLAEQNDQVVKEEETLHRAILFERVLQCRVEHRVSPRLILLKSLPELLRQRESSSWLWLHRLLGLREFWGYFLV